MLKIIRKNEGHRNCSNCIPVVSSGANNKKRKWGIAKISVNRVTYAKVLCMCNRSWRRKTYSEVLWKDCILELEIGSGKHTVGHTQYSIPLTIASRKKSDAKYTLR